MSLAIFNAFEASFWAGLAGFITWRYWRAEHSVRRLARVATIFLLLFAVSDVIEMRTGAWWRPIWLLLLKALCLFGCGWRALRLHRPAARRNDD